ncbi:hypothetical protein D3C72_2348250 [compost metagenome]
MRKTGARPDCQLQSGLQVEEGHGAVLELLADDACGGQAQAVAVEAHRTLQVIDTQRDQRNPGSHGGFLLYRPAA